MAISEQLLDGINTLQIGNSCGFDVIYNETSSYVYARARMIMKDEQDAEDLVQDTYIQAYQNITSLQDPQNIFAWLGGIAYRQGMKIYRKKKDVLLDEDCEGFFEQIESEDIAWSPEISAEQEAVGNIVAEIIDELPPLQKAALTAFYYDEMKIDQIAQMYDCSSNTIKSRLNYAKKFVRDKVEKKEQQENIRLHSAGGVLIIFLGLHQLLDSPKYAMVQTVSRQIYSSVCQSLHLDRVVSPEISLNKKSLNDDPFKNSSLKTNFLRNNPLITKTAVIAGSVAIGTVAAVAISIFAYHHLFPTISESPDHPVTVMEFNTQNPSENSEITEVPEVTETSKTTKIPEATEASEVTDTYDVTEGPETIDTTESLEKPKDSEEQKSSENPKKSETKKASEKSKNSETKITSDNSKKSETKKNSKKENTPSEFSFDDEPTINVTVD